MTTNELSYEHVASPQAMPRTPVPPLTFPLWVVAVTFVLHQLLRVLASPDLHWLFAFFLLPLVGLVVVAGWLVVRAPLPRRAKAIWLVWVVVCAAVALLLSEKLTRIFALFFGVPLTFAVLILFAAAARGRGRTPSPVAFLLVGVVGLLPAVLLRTNGQQGKGMISFVWRWSSTREQKVAAWASGAATTRPVSAADVTEATGDWPAFRGPARDGILPGVAMRLPAGAAFDPKPRWRHPVGLGWSSFAVVGNLAFIQEQRESQACVVCYDVADGRQVWIHTDDDRFDEMSGGPGPRATPAVAGGRVFAFSPTGLLTCLDAVTGKVVWRDKTYATASDKPLYGFTGSPVVVDGKVIIGTTGAGGVDLAAFDAATGKPLWQVAGGKAAYTSPVVGTIGGVRQVVFLDGEGVSGHSLDDGKRLWSVGWSMREPKSATPRILDDSTVLVGMGYGNGLRLLKINHSDDSWSAAEKWHARTLNPKFNDFVCHDGYVYGLDEGVMACVSLADGKRKWRDGRYGYGQLLLVGSHFIVLAESGEVAIVAATPEKFTEVARFQAIEGKTWANPVLVRGNLLVRNSDEAACYDLSPWLVPAPHN